jgi:hypothetical protein
MRLAIRLLGLDLLALVISTDDDTAETSYEAPDLGSDVVYSEPSGTLGFSLPSTEYDYGDDE